MPRVQTGNVTIPGEHLNDYLQALEEATVARAAFRSTLKGYTTEVARHLATKYTQRTVRKHTAIIALLSDFLCDYTDVQRIEDVTRGMVNSQFRRWYKDKVWDQTDAQDLRVALKKFFQFLDQHKGIRNPTALAALA